MAYTLQRDAAVITDQSLVAAVIARPGTDADAFASSVTENGAVAELERALEEAAFAEETPVIEQIDDDELTDVVEASVISMANWVRQVNAANAERNG